MSSKKYSVLLLAAILAIQPSFIIAAPQQQLSSSTRAIASTTTTSIIILPTNVDNSTLPADDKDNKDAPPTAEGDETAAAEEKEAEEDACTLALDGDYDKSIHLIALFTIMAVSLLGVVIPVGARHVHSGASVNTLFFQCAKLFGAGVILCTAFIHILSPAIELLTNPCLPTFFTETYSSLACAIALFGALSTHLIQLMASRAISNSMGPDHTPFSAGAAEAASVAPGAGAAAHHHPLPGKDEKELHKRASTLSGNQDVETLSTSSTSAAPIVQNNTILCNDTQTPQMMAELHTGPLSDDHGHHLILLKEKRVTTYILELGIATHSIIIGLALGVTRGPEAKTLFAALVFHQFFEGIALSTVVMETQFRRLAVTWGMVLFYVLTTPIGILIGIAINSSYNANARSSLISQGILEALAAGILAYDALVNIIFLHFQSSDVKKMRGWRVGMQVLCLWLGATGMAIIGAWA
ncbi:high-affinity Zn(2+) transporter zrt1 [Phlyctochytrium planicorne]|nr:high-affinity Zn(2+) transporter zrt1 [Phlyctochytrium planicorne]